MVGVARETDLLDRVGMGAISVYVLTILAAPAYGEVFGEAILVAPKYASSAVPTAIVGSILLVTVFDRRFHARLSAPTVTESTATGDSIWNEAILYAVTYFPAAAGSGLVLLVANAVVSGAFEAPPVAHHVVATVLTMTALALRRRGRLEFPEWLQASSWGLWDHVGLFGAVFLLTYDHATAAFGPTGALPALLATLWATVAVLLWRAGTLVPDPRGPDPRGPDPRGHVSESPR